MIDDIEEKERSRRQLWLNIDLEVSWSQNKYGNTFKDDFRYNTTYLIELMYQEQSQIKPNQLNNWVD